MSFKAAVEIVSFKSDSTDPSHDLCFRESLKVKQLRKKSWQLFELVVKITKTFFSLSLHTEVK